ncbi:MAG: zinc ABC transporter substrate-binding protein, partial [Clostridia bacterium]|nr:zinc ABC transporter substrate-binding protein [Clostridia bacterium]
CSAESEASFQTIVFLAGKVDALGLPAVLTIENAQPRIAETIVDSTKAKNQKILALNSLQGATAKDAAEGLTYLSAMEDNLKVLKEALN